MRRRSGRWRPRPARPKWMSWRISSARPSVRSSFLAAVGGRRPAARRSPASPRHSPCRSPPAFAALIFFHPLHPCYAGDLGIGPNPKLLARIKAADLVVLIGGRLGEMPSQGYTLFPIPAPQTTLVHVHPGDEELGRVYRRIWRFMPARRRSHRRRPGWRQPPNRAGAPRPRRPTRIISPSPNRRPRCPGASISARSWCGCATTFPLTPSSATGRQLLRLDPPLLPASASSPPRFAPMAGSMGYGLPAAIGMKRVFPIAPPSHLRDGDFLMTGRTSRRVQFGAPVIAIIADNGLYGTIRMHQEREYPGRISATELRNPDSPPTRRRSAVSGSRSKRPRNFAAAFRAAEQSGLPAIIHLEIDPKRSRPRTDLAKIREAALRASTDPLFGAGRQGLAGAASPGIGADENPRRPTSRDTPWPTAARNV